MSASGSPPNAKSRWARMGGVVRRASLVLAPTRASTPSIASIERDSDTASLKGSVRSIPFTPPSVLVPSKSFISHPSPIPESPVQQPVGDIPQPPTVVPSPLVQAPLIPDPEQVASPVQEYTPPPLIDSSNAVGPGGFTDEPDDLPQPQVIRDPSLNQDNSTDGYEPITTEPTVTSGPGGFSDNYDDLPQPQVIKAPSIQRSDSSYSHKPPSVAAVASATGGFDDELPQPQAAKKPSIHVVSTPPVLSASPALTPTVPNTPEFDVSQPLLAHAAPIHAEPTDTSDYFGLPLRDEPESDSTMTHESVQDFKKQLEDNDVAPQPTLENQEEIQQGSQSQQNMTMPAAEAHEETDLVVQEEPQSNMPMPVPEPAVIHDDESDQSVYPPSEMPTPDPPPAIQGSTFPPLGSYSGQEVWGGIAHGKEGEPHNEAPYSRSRASSIHSMPSEDPFADPMAPIITVSRSTPPPSMPQPQISDPYPQLPIQPDEDPRIVLMPLPPVHEAIPSRSMYIPSTQTLPMGYHETDERLPLLQQTTSPKVASYLQPSAASQNVVDVSPQSGVPTSSPWPIQAVHQGPRLHDFGWIEYQLPDSTVYYVHPTRRVTADIDLRDERRLDTINAYFETHRDGGNAPAGMELWLKEDTASGRGAFGNPVRLLVNHKQRLVSFDQSSTISGSTRWGRKNLKVEDDQLDIEYRYWSFMEAHPAHTSLPPNARVEAMDVLTWAWTDRLLPTQHSIPAPFTQEECQELMSLLRSFEQSDSGLQTVVHTRVVSRILLRVATWRQQFFRPNKPLPVDVGHHDISFTRQRRPFGRVLVDFIVSCLCLGIPYIFFERGRQYRIDEESGIRGSPGPGPMLIIGACACLTAAIVLSASVTFLSLPGLDNFARVAGFVAILFATSSMVSTLVAIFRYKADMDNPVSHVAGEGLMMITRRSVVISLPLVFLVYSIVAFVTGVVLYSFWGLSNDELPSHHPFEAYTKWTVVGVLGGLGGMLFTSLLLLRR